MIRLKPLQIVAIWNFFTTLDKIGFKLPDPAEVFRKKFMIYAAPEVFAWNSYTTTQRDLVIHDDIEIAVSKVKSQYAPPEMVAYYADTLKLIFDGDLPEPQPSQIQQKLNQKTNKAQKNGKSTSNKDRK